MNDSLPPTTKKSSGYTQPLIKFEGSNFRWPKGVTRIWGVCVLIVGMRKRRDGSGLCRDEREKRDIKYLTVCLDCSLEIMCG